MAQVSITITYSQPSTVDETSGPETDIRESRKGISHTVRSFHGESSLGFGKSTKRLEIEARRIANEDRRLDYKIGRRCQ